MKRIVSAAFAALAAMVGISHTVSADPGVSVPCNPRFSRGRRNRQYKSIDASLTGEALIKAIAGEINVLGGRVEAVEKKGDIGKLAETLETLKSSLDEVKSKAPEFKDFTGKLETRLDEMERKLNRAAVNSEKDAKPVRFREAKGFDALHAAMKAGEKVEVKSLDSGLKVQSIFHDEQLLRQYPLMSRVFRRPCLGDKPKLSYYTGSTVIVKGSEETQAQGERVKVELTVDTLEFQPTLDREDVQDEGALMLDDAMTSGKEDAMRRVNADTVDAIEAAGLAKASINTETLNRTKVAIIETATAATLTEADLLTAVGEIAVNMRAGCVWLMSPAMAATVRNIQDGNERSLWVNSLQEGTPARLLGYDVIEDENVATDRLIFGNPARGSAVLDREEFHLDSMEKLAGNYKPYMCGRVARGNYNCRAWKILKIKEATGS